MTGQFWTTATTCVSSGGLPAHVQIEAWLVAAIECGELSTGEKLPNERSLAASLGVSRMTLRQALSALDTKGYVTRRRGNDGGTFISRPELEIDLTDIAGLSAQIVRARRIAGANVVRAHTIRASAEVARELRLAPADKVHRIVRVRLADGAPIGIEHSYFPATRFPDMLDHPLDGSLYAVLSALGGAPTEAREYLKAALIEPENAELLGVVSGAAVMVVERLATDANREPVEFSRDVFRSDQLRLLVQSSLRT